jgi:hypothetical protein
MTCSFCGTKNNIAATEFFSDGDSFMTLYSCHACGTINEKENNKETIFVKRRKKIS